MRISMSRRLCSAGVALVLVGAGGVIAAEAGGATPDQHSPETPAVAVRTRAVCGAVTGRRARCSAVEVLNPDALVRGSKRPPPRTTTTSASTTSTSASTTTTSVPSGSCNTAHAGYTPCDLQSAYALPSSSAGGGRTVGIVDAHGDPKPAADPAR